MLQPTGMCECCGDVSTPVVGILTRCKEQGGSNQQPGTTDQCRAHATGVLGDPTVIGRVGG